MKRIDRTTTIEELVDGVPGVVSYLINEGLACIVCGEPVWGTLGEMAHEKGRTDEEIGRLVADMNRTLVLKDAV
jgi:hypothetical protein